MLDVEKAVITSIHSLGWKDHNNAANPFDPSDLDGPAPLINNWPVYGMYQPDETRSFRCVCPRHEAGLFLTALCLVGTDTQISVGCFSGWPSCVCVCVRALHLASQTAVAGIETALHANVCTHPVITLTHHCMSLHTHLRFKGVDYIVTANEGDARSWPGGCLQCQACCQT